MNWATLERGLLRDVFTRLTDDDDAASFRRVCHHWRVAAAAGALVARPWFVFTRPLDGARAYVHPKTRRRGRCPRSLVKVVRMLDTVFREGDWPQDRVRAVWRGWLAMSEGERLFLRDPIAGVEVPLPAVIDSESELLGIFLSDDPLTVPGGEFEAFAYFKKIHCPFPGHLLASYRPGDAEWTLIDPNDGYPGPCLIRFYRGLEFFRGRTYIVLYDYRIAVVDVDLGRLLVSSVMVDPSSRDDMFSQECLVECGGDLLFVQVRQIFVYPESSRCCISIGSPYEVKHSVSMTKIKLDDADGMPVQAWEVDVDIGDYALFMAPQSQALALRASSFPSVKAGCLYHFSTNLKAKNVTGMVVSDMRQHPHRHENVVKLPVNAPPWRPLSWFFPRDVVMDTTTKCRKIW